MNKDDQSVTRKDKVWTTGKIFSVQAKTMAQAVRDAADDEFGSGVASSDPGHHLASSLAVHNVRHRLSAQRWRYLETFS